METPRREPRRHPRERERRAQELLAQGTPLGVVVPEIFEPEGLEGSALILIGDGQHLSDALRPTFDRDALEDDAERVSDPEVAREVEVPLEDVAQSIREVARRARAHHRGLERRLEDSLDGGDLGPSLELAPIAAPAVSPAVERDHAEISAREDHALDVRFGVDERGVRRSRAQGGGVEHVERRLARTIGVRPIETGALEETGERRSARDRVLHRHRVRPDQRFGEAPEGRGRPMGAERNHRVRRDLRATHHLGDRADADGRRREQTDRGPEARAARAGLRRRALGAPTGGRRVLEDGLGVGHEGRKLPHPGAPKAPAWPLRGGPASRLGAASDRQLASRSGWITAAALARSRPRCTTSPPRTTSSAGRSVSW